MKKKAMLFLLGMLLGITPSKACLAQSLPPKSNVEAVVSGWVREQSDWKYYENGKAKQGWLHDNDIWYYLEPGSGRMFREGWKKIDGVWYWFKPWGGAAANQWQYIGGKWYRFNQWAQMKSSAWFKQGADWYYLKPSGAMAIGKQKINDIYYFFQKNGAYREKPMIALDAGHQQRGNSEKEPIGPGASVMKPKVASGTKGVATGKWEYELNLEVTLKLCDELLKRGYPVYMIRESHEVNISNAGRALLAAQKKAEVLVRIHANGSNNKNVHGVLTIAPSLNNPYVANIAKQSRQLSKSVVDAFVGKTGAKNGGVLQSDEMTGINWSKIPVTIVEMGYMSNLQEDLQMANPSYQQKMAEGIADGIDGYFA